MIHNSRQPVAPIRWLVKKFSTSSSKEVFLFQFEVKALEISLQNGDRTALHRARVEENSTT